MLKSPLAEVYRTRQSQLTAATTQRLAQLAQSRNDHRRSLRTPDLRMALRFGTCAPAGLHENSATSSETSPFAIAVSRATVNPCSTRQLISFTEKASRSVRIFRRLRWISEDNTLLLPRRFTSSTILIGSVTVSRSEERRVGKECRSRWSP